MRVMTVPSTKSLRPHDDPWRAGIRLTFVALILLGLAIFLFNELLLFFAAALFAVVLRAPSEWLERRTGMNVRLALALVLTIIAAAIGLTVWLVGHSIVAELEGVWTRLPEVIEKLRGQAEEFAAQYPAVENATTPSSSAIMRGGLATVTATTGAIASLGLIVFVAVLLAIDPGTYVRGALRLLPVRHRKRADEVASEVGNVLRRWTLGQFSLMVLVGVLSYVGLRVVGVEYAAALALISGALTFIPFLGPLISGGIAILVALPQGLNIALYTAGVYVGVQIVEGLCGPFVQQRAVYLAPALLLFSQVVLGALAGLPGMILATPLAAAGIVIIKMLYIEDALGDRA
jgi:predicted PurR-regulated permease PerM